jgi:hypothetical protein
MRMVTCAVLLALVCSSASAGLLAVPKDYTPDKSWPVIVCTQDGPSKELAANLGYFLIHAGGKGVETSSKIRTYLLNCAKKYNIDPFRIYATSFSRGGHEILTQSWQFPDRFAAIAPICNDLRSKPKVFNVKYLVNTPTLLLHGTGDSFRNTGKALFELMKAAKCDVKYETYPGGHSPTPIFKKDLKRVTDFFEQHKLNPFPKQVVHLVEHKRYARAFWVDSTPARDAGNLKGSFKVTVKDGNVIEVEASEDIAALHLYLNDKLVDMKKPVKVVCDGKTLYEGAAASPLNVNIREGKKLWQRRAKPLWQEIQEIRQKAAAKK